MMDFSANQIKIEYRKQKMKKTQVIKLNTSKDNIGASFDKIKTKITEVQSEIDRSENFDITIIVMHENQHLNKSNQHRRQHGPTLKSILSQNDLNVQRLTHKQTKPKTVNQQNQVQSLIVDTDLSIKREDFEKNAIKSCKESYVSGKKLRQSNKMPQIGSIFRFQKKGQQQIAHKQNNRVVQICEIAEQPQRNLAFSQFQTNKKFPSFQENSSQASDQQQFDEQNLKKSISRKQIDIFPNIQITSVVSDQLFSKHSVNHLKPNRQKRRCSIADESLLSPRKREIAGQIKEQIRKTNLEQVKYLGGNRQKTIDKLLGQIDSVNEIIHGKTGGSESVQQKSTKKGQVKQFMQLETNDILIKHVKMPKSKVNDRQQRQKHQVKKRTFNALSRQKPSTTSFHSSQSSSSSNQQPQQQSIHVIQNKLNECIRLLQSNQLSVLQDYLYEFKDKYFYVSNARVQIKWRLLMAHCKQNKKEFQRAAIYYNNVIDLAKENPKSLTIQPAEVYHRLGVCYSEIAQWNKGILAFAEALNTFKKAKNFINYSESMNNLGTLYLQASSLSLAQKCFIQAYDLKKSLYGKTSTKLLTSLFNIFECNLLTKNYDQAQKVISVIQEQIITHIPQSQPTKHLYIGGLYRRKGKMQFLRGNNQLAERHYLISFEKLQSKYPYCMEFGQLMACLGLLKLEDWKFKEAKKYFDKAIMLMNFYCSKDSATILTLKKNLQYSVKMIKEQREGSSSK